MVNLGGSGVNKDQGMFRVAVAAMLCASLALGGCQTARPRSGATVEVGPPLKSAVWMAIASNSDRSRLERLGLAWSEGLAGANKRYQSAVQREGALLRPRAALPRPNPTPGSYNCRLIELGKVGKNDKAFQSYKPFFCYIQIDGDQLSFVKQTGSQRPAGILWDDDEGRNRMVFLGSMARGAEDKTLAYGDDPKRDLAGVFERIAPFRWRLVIPWPQDDAKIAIYELTPVANQPE